MEPIVDEDYGSWHCFLIRFKADSIGENMCGTVYLYGEFIDLRGKPIFIILLMDIVSNYLPNIYLYVHRLVQLPILIR